MKVSNVSFNSSITYKSLIPNIESQEIPKFDTNAQEVLDTPHSMDSSMVKHSIFDFIQQTPNLSLDTNYKKSDIVAKLLQDELLIKTAKTNKTQAQEKITQNQFYGYSIDESGYMGEDFNASAGLPSGFKLHQSTLEEIIKNGQENYGKNYTIFSKKPISNEEVFKHIDIANTMKQYYNLFTQIIPEIKESYSLNEIEKMPKGFSDTRDIANHDLEYTNMSKMFDMQTLEHFKVTNLYNTQEEYKEAKVLESQLESIGFNFKTHELNFSATEMKNLSFYASENESFSQEALFVSFLKSQNAGILGGGETQLSRIVKEHREQQRIEYIKENSGKLSLEEVNLQKQALQSPEKLEELIKFKLQDSMELLGQSKTFAPNEIAANFGGVVMDIYSFTQLGHSRSSLDSNAQSVNLTMKFTEAVHNNWTISPQDIKDYTQNLYHRTQNFLHKTSV